MKTFEWGARSRGREPELSRRGWLVGVLASGVWGCQAGEVNAAATRAAAPTASSAAGGGGGPAGEPAAVGLDVARLGPMREDEKGGTLVVLLHGWRARGNDLVPLARRLAQAGPRSRFLVPAAPLAEPGGGRAWWRLDGAARPAHAWKDELPSDFRPNAEVAAARQAVQAVLRDARRRYAPDVIAVAGFSQGAMLALDVAIAAEPAVDRVAALSGVVIADSLAVLRRGQRVPPAVFVAHGRQDPVLPFAGGASVESVLGQHGYRVRFLPFEGGHEIPAAVVAELGSFLFG